MDITDAIIRYRRFLKRMNTSPNTVKNYLNGLKLYVIWLDVPIEETTYRKIIAYMDYLLVSGRDKLSQKWSLESEPL